MRSVIACVRAFSVTLVCAYALLPHNLQEKQYNINLLITLYNGTVIFKSPGPVQLMATCLKKVLHLPLDEKLVSS